MVKFIDVVNNLCKPFYKPLVTVIVFLILLYVGYWGYKQFYEKNFESMDTLDVANASGNKQVSILFFHADWCPHCRKAQPIWDEFVTAKEESPVKGYKIDFKDVDCTSDKNTEVQALIDQYKIESYPTIKMIKGKDVIDFDAKITPSSLDAFVNQMLV